MRRLFGDTVLCSHWVEGVAVEVDILFAAVWRFLQAVYEIVYETVK